jgi:hypothetical protein
MNTARKRGLFAGSVLLLPHRSTAEAALFFRGQQQSESEKVLVAAHLFTKHSYSR